MCIRDRFCIVCFLALFVRRSPAICNTICFASLKSAYFCCSRYDLFNAAWLRTRCAEKNSTICMSMVCDSVSLSYIKVINNVTLLFNTWIIKITIRAVRPWSSNFFVSTRRFGPTPGCHHQCKELKSWHGVRQYDHSTVAKAFKTNATTVL